MSKMNKVTIAIISGLLLIMILTGSALSTGSDNSVCVDDMMPEGAVGYYTTMDGELHWIIPGGEIGVDDFSGMTREEIFEAIKMAPEDEAKIVHRVPPCPEIIIDGVVYKSEDINKFDGQQLGFTVGHDGKLYAFTTEEGLQKFSRDQVEIRAVPDSGGTILSNDPIYSRYYWDWFYNGPVINLDYRISLDNMPPLWDNQISSLRVNTSCYATRLYENEVYSGNYFQALAGTSYALLWLWNDRASSILHINY